MEITLQDKRTSFEVRATSGEFSLDGARASVSTSGDVKEFNGSILKSGSFVGSFYYDEVAGRISVNLSDVASANYQDCQSFVLSCVESFKTASAETAATAAESAADAVDAASDTAAAGSEG